MQSTVAADGSSADIAWMIGRSWQRQGFASEAAVAVVEWLTAEGVERIRALIHPEHHASAAVAARAGLSSTNEIVDGEEVWVRDVR
jgi:RimJ/RimL family protein N-acetyltransferase